MNKIYRKYYTIIELLLAIGIIAALAAMGAPAAMKFISKQDETRAQQEIQAIKQAVKAYEAEYGKLPLATGTNAITTELIDGAARLDPESSITATTDFPKTALFFKALMGRELNTVDNPRKIEFLKWLDNYGDEDGVADNWLDPWGQPYVIMVDYDYNGLIEETVGDGGINLDADPDKDEAHEQLRGSFFVFSRGEDMVCGLDDFTDAAVVELCLGAGYDSVTPGVIVQADRPATIKDDVKSW